MHLSRNENPEIDKMRPLIANLKSSGQPFIYDSEDELSEEYAHFYFIGVQDGKEVLFDAVFYTLRMQHESELFEIAEQAAAQNFPGYRKINIEEDEKGNGKAQDELEEEIGLYMAEVMMELEEEGEIKVKEHVDLDLTHSSSKVLYAILMPTNWCWIQAIIRFKHSQKLQKLDLFFIKSKKFMNSGIYLPT